MISRSSLGSAILLVAALLACSSGNQVTRRYERVGASPPLDGPRAVGPVAKKGEGSLQGGATVARVKTLERGVEQEAPSNVVSRTMFHAGYFRGVTRGLELGGAVMLAHTKSGDRLARDATADRLDDTLFGGATFSLRGVLIDDEVFFLVGTSELAFWMLPYHERVTESVNSGPFIQKQDFDASVNYLQLRVGLSAGVHASQTVSLGTGLLFQNYPVFLSATQTRYCDPDCHEDAPDLTEFGTAMTPFMWLGYAPGRLSLSFQAWTTASASHDLASALPYGGTFVLGYRLGGADTPTREPSPPSAAEPRSPGREPYSRERY
ncbi:MAG: hypothetical protein HYZ29_29680 [Myxococcales bacterium]|nr:hypothetical protein [Myxococcales bacterium]